MAKRGPKFTKTEREQKLAEAARLDSLGWNQYQIADAIGVSQAQAGDYLRTVRERYQAASQEHHIGGVGKAVNQLSYTIKEVTEAWDRSKLPAEKVVTKEVPVEDCAICGGTGKRETRKIGKREMKGGPCSACQGKGSVGGVVEMTKTVEGRLPDPAYLQLFLKAVEGLRDVLGIDAPKQVHNVNENTNVEQWNVLVSLADGPTLDSVEPKLVAALEEASKELPKPLKLHEEGNGEATTNGHKEP